MLNVSDRSRLRSLAARQAEIAASEPMRRLYGEWRLHGAFDRAARPMVTVELWTFAEEIIPSMLACRSERAREIESQLLMAVAPHTLFHDDTPVRSYYPVALHERFVPFGLQVRKHVADPSGGAGVGHRFEGYLTDLERDYGKLGKSLFHIDLDATRREMEELDAIFGDILPVRRGGEPIMVAAAEDIIHLIDMQHLYLALLDTPDLVHAMMERLLLDYGLYLDALEQTGLHATANDEALPQGSYCFNARLPGEGTHLTTHDLWGYMDAEEFNDVSPAMYKAFIIDHYIPFARRFGALSFGCCEAIHRVWDGCVENLPNLAKVSVSAWCDQRFMGERLCGRDIVFLRKPTANLLGLSGALEEDAVRAHFDETARAASGCRLEVSQRDVYRVDGGTARVRRYVALIRESLDRCWKP